MSQINTKTATENNVDVLKYLSSCMYSKGDLIYLYADEEGNNELVFDVPGTKALIKLLEGHLKLIGE